MVRWRKKSPVAIADDDVRRMMMAAIRRHGGDVRSRQTLFGKSSGVDRMSSSTGTMRIPSVGRRRNVSVGIQDGISLRRRSKEVGSTRRGPNRLDLLQWRSQRSRS